MTAVILAFPRRSSAHALTRAVCGAAPFSASWCEAHLPIVAIGLELLEADDAAFTQRCQLMADQDGRMLAGELAGQLERLGAYLADVADAMSIVALRICDGMAALA